MTAPIPPGGIVSVPDESGGAGAAVVTSQIVNANWANGIALLNKAFLLSDKAVNADEPAPQILTPTLDTSYLPPAVPVLPGIEDPAEAKALYDSARLEIQALTEGGYATFLNTYFPDDPYYPAALAWIARALTTGGTGINATVEQQLWERARSRLSVEASRAEADAMSAFANRGFDLPPGALVHSLQLIGQDRRDKLAEASRDTAIESFKAELENVRFAITNAIDLKAKAVAAAGDYIRTLLEGPKTAMQLATAQIGLSTEFSRTMVQFYSAQSAAAEPRVRLAIADAQIQAQVGEANLRAKSATEDARARAAQANAHMVASAAAASLNGIHAGASISGGDSSSV